ncbi:MAG: COG1470 family protein, partial [Candidatus Hodarchaeales archaeon]
MSKFSRELLRIKRGYYTAALFSVMLITVFTFSVISSSTTEGMELEVTSAQLEASSVAREELLKSTHLMEDNNILETLDEQLDLEQEIENQLSSILDLSSYSFTDSSSGNGSLNTSEPLLDWAKCLLSMQSIPAYPEFREANVKILEHTETSLVTETQLADNISLVETTRYLKKPRIKFIEPNMTGLDSFIVPVIRSKSAGAGLGEVETRVVEKEVIFGLDIGIDWYKGFSYNLGWIKPSAYVTFDVRFRMVFPVKVRLEYPSQVIAGENYEYSVKIIPLDKPDYDEFVFKVVAGLGFKLKAKFPALRWIKKSKRIWGIKIYWWKPQFYWKWKNLFSQHIGPKMETKASYKTPMGDVPAIIRMTNIKMGSLDFSAGLGALSAELGFGGPYGSVVCNKFTAKIRVRSDDTDVSRTKTWGEYHESTKRRILNSILDQVVGAGIRYKLFNSELTEFFDDLPDYVPENRILSFSIPESDKSESVTFSVSQLRFYPYRISVNPKFYIKFGGILKDLGTLHLPIIRLPILLTVALRIAMGASSVLGGTYYIPSSAHYKTTTAVDNAAFYDFEQTITPEENVDEYYQHYKVNLVSTGTKPDSIELVVSDLPAGYTASFDRNPAVYDIKPGYPAEAILTIHVPDKTTLSPGLIDFTLVATSQAKTQLGKDATVSSISQFTVPEIRGFDFKLDIEPGEEVLLESGVTLPVGFSAANEGNVAETLTVDAALYCDNDTYYWTRTFTISQYGSNESQFFNGEFDVIFDFEHQNPPPGLYQMEFNITSSDGELKATDERFLEFTAAWSFETALTPGEIDLLGSYAREFTFSITNTGNIADNYTILSSGWDQYLDYSPRVYNLPVGEQTNITVILSIDNPSEVPEGEKSFQIIAVSEASGDEMVSSFSTATVNVLPPDETAPGLEQVYAGQNLTYPFSTPLDLGPIWVPRDDNPDKFTIFVNDIDVFNGSWSDGESYHVNMSGYTVGVYNVTAAFNDTSGNVKTDMVWVTITLTDSSAPVITPPLNQTLPANFIDPLELTWNIHEENLLNATLYRNG